IQEGDDGEEIDIRDGEPTVEDWEAIAECEAGGNWSTDTGNGYYGGLQFDKQTWDSVNGGEFAETPDQATKDEQISKALELWRERGWSPWGCATSQGYTGGPGEWQRPGGLNVGSGDNSDDEDGTRVVEDDVQPRANWTFFAQGDDSNQSESIGES